MKVADILTAFDLSVVSSWASIVGLLLTVFTFLLLIGIKKKFLFRSGIDGHLIVIGTISSEISPLFVSYAQNHRELEEKFALADVELRAMQRGASGDLLADIKKTRRMIRGYSSNLYFWVKKNEASAREIKKNLSVVSAELSHHRRSVLVGN